MTFEQFGLSPALLQALQEKGYTRPSPVQRQVIPAILSGRDVLAAAQTGTGKTAGFALPVLQRLQGRGGLRPHCTRALIITPTRELAAQVAQSVDSYAAHLPLRCAAVFGGVKINPQIARLRQGTDILIATPGRLLDLHQQGGVSFEELEILVLDEADRMLDMGFIHDIRRIIELLPIPRQNLLFSATFSAEIRKLSGTILQRPLAVQLSAANTTAAKVEQWLHPVDKKRKPALLHELIASQGWTQVLVFTRTRQGANRLGQQLQEAGLGTEVIHSSRNQDARTRALDAFKQGRVRVLVATDVAARGLDIAQLPQVVNFDLPDVPEDYVHRIGRTGRAGASGTACSLVSADEIKQLNAIEQLIQRHITREYISGFEPDHEVPASAPLRRPPKTRRQAAAGGGAHAATSATRGRGGQRPDRPRRRRKPRAGSGK